MRKLLLDKLQIGFPYNPSYKKKIFYATHALSFKFNTINLNIPDKNFQQK